jgi:3-phosphoshikimate 1-carboxyvinyltransferase
MPELADVVETRADRLRSTRSGPLNGSAAIPPDKSMSHRALIIGALAEGETRVSGLLESDDVLATARALRAFGIWVERDRPGEWRVTGGGWRSPEQPIDCGNSGTAARLMIGAAAGLPIRATFTGDESLRSRPMDRLTGPLAAMGARFDRMDRLPLTVAGGRLTGIEHVNTPASAQVKSAVLLAGVNAQGEFAVIEPAPTRDHTEIMLSRFGCEVEVDGTRVRLGKRRALRAAPVEIPADPSSAAFAWAASAIVPGSRVETPGVLVNPLRSGLLHALKRMGAEVRISERRRVSGEEVADVTVAHAELRPIALPADTAPSLIDELPLLAVVAAFAPGVSRIDGAGELRFKESDRLEAVVSGLRACGVEASAEGDTLVVAGGAVRGGIMIDSRRDHRIAMAFLVLGLGSEQPIEVTGAEMIATSFPGFAETMRSIGADIR